MHLVQILIPLFDGDGHAFSRELLDAVRDELADRFGGVTAHLRAPAHGVWKEEDGGESHDQVVTVEVLVDAIDREWWRAYRAELERRFRQDEVLMLAFAVDRL